MMPMTRWGCRTRPRNAARRAPVATESLVRSAGDLLGSLGTERIMTEPAERKQSLQPPAPATARDVMRPALTTLEPNDHVAAAAYLMKHANSTALVVVEDEETKQPTGLITDTDIVRAVAEGKDVNEIRIHDLMTTTPTAIHPTTSIREAARIMLAGQFRHLPVVDETGLVGMVEISDVCGALLELPGDLSREPPVSNG